MQPTTSKEFTVRGSRPEELEESVATTAAAFKVPMPATSYREFLLTKCLDLENIRVLLYHQDQSSRIVGSNTIFRFQTHFGPKILNAAGLAWVGVHPDYQRKGLGLYLLEDCISYLEQAHCDVCFLYTSTMQFYHQRGWEVGFGVYKWILPTVKISTLESPKAKKFPTLRPFASQDLPQIHELYAMSNKGHPGTCVRDLSYWQRMLKVDPSIGERLYCFQDGATIVGYILLEEPGKSPAKQLAIEEYGLQTLHSAKKLPDLEDALLNALKTLASERSCTELGFSLPDTYPLVDRIKKMGAQDQSSLFCGLMVRIMDLHSFLSKWDVFYNGTVAPRVSRADIDRIRDTTLILTVEGYGILLRKEGSNVHLEIVQDLPQSIPRIPIDRSIVAILALGNVSPSNLVESEMWACPAQYLPLLDRAFPDIHLVLYHLDKF